MAESSRVTVRLDEDELKLLDERADELGITRSELIRFLIRADVLAIWMDRDEPKPECYPYIDAASAVTIARELSHAGPNLNQTAHRLNTLQHWAVQGKASGLDWRTYTDLAKQSLDEANRHLAIVSSVAEELVCSAGWNRKLGAR